MNGNQDVSVDEINQQPAQEQPAPAQEKDAPFLPDSFSPDAVENATTALAKASGALSDFTGDHNSTAYNRLLLSKMHAEEEERNISDAAKTRKGIALWIGEDPHDPQEVNRRIRDTVILLTNDTENLLNQNVYNLKGDYKKSAKFLHEMIEKGNFPYEIKFEPDDLAKEAEETYAKHPRVYRQTSLQRSQQIKLNQTNGVAKKDMKKVRNAFASCKNADDVAKQYEKLLNKILDGKVVLDGLDVKNRVAVHRGPAGIVHVTSYLDKILNDPECQNIDKSKLTADYVKDISLKAVDEDRVRAEAVRNFKTQFGISANYATVDENAAEFNRRGGSTLDVDKATDMSIPDSLEANSEKDRVRLTGLLKHLSENKEVRDRLIGDAVATYADYERHHNNHSFFYRVFHPFKYSDESATLNSMKKVFTKILGYSETELNDLKEKWLPFSKNAIYTNYRHSSMNKDEYTSIVNDYNERDRERNRLKSKMTSNLAKFGYGSVQDEKELIQQLDSKEYQEAIEHYKGYLTLVYNNDKDQVVADYKKLVTNAAGKDTAKLLDNHSEKEVKDMAVNYYVNQEIDRIEEIYTENTQNESSEKFWDEVSEKVDEQKELTGISKDISEAMLEEDKLADLSSYGKDLPDV